jgi:hypothetical protein
MSKRVNSCAKAASAGLLATLVMLGTNPAVIAADDCLAGPDRPPAPGGHWYYRLDHAANRKCWYLVGPAARTPAAEVPAPPPVSDAPPLPTLGSLFSSLSAGFPGPATAPPPDTTTGDARVMQIARPDDPRNDEAAPGRQPRVARHPVTEASLIPKPHRPARARPPAEPADEQAASPAQAERDALFQEFLKWRQRQ